MSHTECDRPDVASELVREVNLLWNWFHRLSSAFCDAYSEEARTMVVADTSLRKRLIDTLADPNRDGDEFARVAQSLGFDPCADFVVACALSCRESDIVRLNRRLAAGAGTALCASGSRGIVVVVAQGISESDLVAQVHDAVPEALLGVGISRTGVAGAAASFVDAHQALERTRTKGRDTHFADDWLLSSLAGNASRLGTLLAVGAEVATKHPALAETVRAYAGNRFSASACARALHLHPNSVTYRLERWSQLTGWNVQTFDGLVRSIICLELCGDTQKVPALTVPR